MVKKKFIEKKNAVTYSLVYRSTEDVDDVPERMLVEADKGVGVGKVDAGVAQAGQDAAAGARRWGQPPPPLPAAAATPASSWAAPCLWPCSASSLLHTSIQSPGLLQSPNPFPVAGTRQATRWRGCRTSLRRRRYLRSGGGSWLSLGSQVKK